MIDSIDYSNYNNNDQFDFDPFKGIICIIIALVICCIITYCTSWNWVVDSTLLRGNKFKLIKLYKSAYNSTPVEEVDKESYNGIIDVKMC